MMASSFMLASLPKKWIYCLAESVISAVLYFLARRRFRAINVPVLQRKKMRLHPIYRNYPYSIHVDNGVPVLPGCFDERNVLQVGTKAYPFYSARIRRLHPIYRNYPYSIHVDNGVPVLPGCFDERNVLQVGTKAYPFYSARIRRLHPIYRNYPYNIHVDGGVPALQDC